VIIVIIVIIIIIIIIKKGNEWMTIIHWGNDRPKDDCGGLIKWGASIGIVWAVFVTVFRNDKITTFTKE